MKCTFLYRKCGISDLKTLFAFCFSIIFIHADRGNYAGTMEYTLQKEKKIQIIATMSYSKLSLIVFHHFRSYY